MSRLVVTGTDVLRACDLPPGAATQSNRSPIGIVITPI